MTRSVQLTLLLTTCVLVAGSIGAQEAKSGAQDEKDVVSHEDGVIFQDEVAGREADIAILVRDTGLPKAEIEGAITFQQEFAAYADKMLARFPDQIAGIWTDPLPAQRGHIRFTGAAPREAAPHGVVFLEGGELSLAENYRRAELAAEALTQDGFRNFLTFYDPISGVIQIEMKLPEGVQEPSQAAVLQSVQRRVFEELPLSGEALVVDSTDLELTVIRGPGDIYELENSRGGNWLLREWFPLCTSGWSVTTAGGVDGIITAGHCVLLDQFQPVDQAPYDMTWVRQHVGPNGDIEFHTTARYEVSEFYASEREVRSVTRMRSTDTMVGGTTCVYGRRSNRRSCSHTVFAVNVNTVFPNGTQIGSQARVSGDATMESDSGGGWSFNNMAWGVHSASDGTWSYFTPIQEALAAVDVYLLGVETPPPTSPPSCDPNQCNTHCGGAGICTPSGQCFCI